MSECKCKGSSGIRKAVAKYYTHSNYIKNKKKPGLELIQTTEKKDLPRMLVNEEHTFCQVRIGELSFKN